MSYDQWIYKAVKGAKLIKEWSEDNSLPLGTQAEIKKMFESLLGPLEWTELENGDYWSQGCFTDHGYEIKVNSDSNIICLKGCSQLQAIDVANKLGICAFDPQYGKQLVS